MQDWQMQWRAGYLPWQVICGKAEISVKGHTPT